jgi:hypothetical protein
MTCSTPQPRSATSTEVADELVEPVNSVQQIPQDDHRPGVGDQLRGASDGADAALE